jgi:hypothetical protein
VKGAAGALCLLLAACQAVASSSATEQVLADKAEIGDLVTRYYYDLNHGGGAHFADYFAEDAELVTDAARFSGRKAIEDAFDEAEKTTPAREV